MYNTTSQFIANARALKTALLISMIADKSIHIETGSAGSVPCVLDKPNQIILNRNFALQMVPADDTSASEPRFLKREMLGKRIGIVTNYDGLSAESTVPLEQCIMLDIRSDRVAALPQSIRERAAFSLSINMPPDAVVELINFVADGPEFDGDKIFALKAYAGTAARTSALLKQDIAAVLSATSESAEAYRLRLRAGVNVSGPGAPSRCAQDVFHVCCADAAIAGRTEFGKQDIIRLVPPVVAHRVDWTGASTAGHARSLTLIADLALSS
jgi:hypothetical protein